MGVILFTWLLDKASPKSNIAQDQFSAAVVQIVSLVETSETQMQSFELSESANTKH
jgi:hypothetical protein